MMHTVCFITPPSQFLLDERVFPALGILKVAAVAEQLGYTVEHLDLNGVENYEQALRDHCGRTKASTFAITATTPQMVAVTKIRAVLRECAMGKRIVLGGPHPTLVHAAFRHTDSERAIDALQGLVNDYDVVVVGDGENAIGAALDSTNTQGLIDADDPKQSLFLTNAQLAELPLPARHLVDMDSYHYSIDGVRVTSVVNQLGCPYGCNFCAGRDSAMLRRVRLRPTQVVLDELEHIYTTYGIRGFMCYDEQTEILTERGWSKFRELTESDKVAVLNPIYDQLTFEKPKRIIKIPYKGDLVTVKSKFIDLAVTPEHNMWIAHKDKYQHVQAKRMVGLKGEVAFLQRSQWEGTDFKTFSIPAYSVVYKGRNGGSPKVKNGVRVFDADLWVQFMAWYLSEGSCYRPYIKRNGRDHGRGYRICIKQSRTANPTKVEEIAALLRALGFRFSYSSDQFHIDSRELYEYLVQFGRSHYKFVPYDFKQMSSRLIRLFIKTYIKGDGHTTTLGQETITSYSDRMRNDLQEMAFKGGYWAALDNHYRVLLSQQRDALLNGNQPDAFGSEPYTGDVHCVTVSTGIVLVRRNGKAVWCGNCFDDELNVNKQFLELLHGMIDLQERLGVEFRCRGFVKAELFTEEQASAMYKAGFRRVMCGFESGSDRILRNINKRATKSDNTRAMEISHKYALDMKALMSVGHPGESEKTVLETQSWLREVRPNDFDVTIITAYPGSPYYDRAKKVVSYHWEYAGTPVWCFETNGDRLYMIDVDYNVTEDFYKGALDAYRSYVFTDYVSAEELVGLRDQVEKDVRGYLGIPFYSAGTPVRFEASMGCLPGSIYRVGKDKAKEVSA